MTRIVELFGARACRLRLDSNCGRETVKRGAPIESAQAARARRVQKPLQRLRAPRGESTHLTRRL